MKRKKNYLDEMQDRKLLKIEEIGVWIAFWGLVIAIAVQFLLGGTIVNVLGEIAVLLALSVYILFSCIRNGIWARDYMPTIKVNAVTSVCSALVFGALLTIKVLRASPDSVGPPIIIAIVLSIIGIFVVCFIVLELVRHLYKKRRAKLEDTKEDE